MKPEVNRKIHVLLVDDHACMVWGLSRLLAEEPDLTVVGTASCLREAECELVGKRPDVVVLDLRLGNNESGFTFVQRAKALLPDVKIIVFSTYDGEIYRRHAEGLGVHGYVAKAEEIAVLKREIFRVARRVGRTSGGPGFGTAMKMLSQSEAQVLKGLAQGLSQKEVAGEIGVSPSTVATHVQRAREKLGVRSIFEMMNLARLIPVTARKEQEEHGVWR
jgi:DNA-binding NarL/FixJ family response regulator